MHWTLLNLHKLCMIISKTVLGTILYVCIPVAKFRPLLIVNQIDLIKIPYKGAISVCLSVLYYFLTFCNKKTTKMEAISRE